MKERRLHEQVYLRDVVAQLPADTLVDVVGRGEVVEDGARRIDHVEHMIVLPEEAYDVLRQVGVMPRARGSQATPGASGVTALDLVRLESAWEDRAARFERLAEDADALEVNPQMPRRLAQMCRQFEAEIAGLRQRVEGEEAKPARVA